MKPRPLSSQEQALFPSFRNKYDFFDEVVVAKILKEHVPRVRVCILTPAVALFEEVRPPGRRF